MPQGFCLNTSNSFTLKSVPQPVVFFYAGTRELSGKQCWSSPKRLCRQGKLGISKRATLVPLNVGYPIISLYIISTSMTLFPVKTVILYDFMGIAVFRHTQLMPLSSGVIIQYLAKSALKSRVVCAQRLTKWAQQWSLASRPVDLVTQLMRDPLLRTFWGA